MEMAIHWPNELPGGTGEPTEMALVSSCIFGTCGPDKRNAERDGREVNQGLSESETKRFRLKRSQKGFVFESRREDDEG